MAGEVNEGMFLGIEPAIEAGLLPEQPSRAMLLVACCAICAELNTHAEGLVKVIATNLTDCTGLGRGEVSVALRNLADTGLEERVPESHPQRFRLTTEARAVLSEHAPRPIICTRRPKRSAP